MARREVFSEPTFPLSATVTGPLQLAFLRTYTTEKDFLIREHGKHRSKRVKVLGIRSLKWP